jgi:TFIIF-interacting CTD phosphatase-like protein
MSSTHSGSTPKVRINYIITSLEKKTLVLDIDETLVYATTNRNEMKLIDETIQIKMTKFGAGVRAFLSYRPYLFEFLDALRIHFELILYTCGTAPYAAAFSESVEKNGGKKYFDHVLSLQHCLFSMENEIYIKDLKILEEGRSLKDIVIVDNTI